jgi:hypothetical protein
MAKLQGAKVERARPFALAGGQAERRAGCDGAATAV